MRLEDGWRLPRLAPDEVKELQRLLGKLTDQLAGQPEPQPLSPALRERAVFADRVYRSRRMRSRYFPEYLFADPAWDILLLLFSLQPSGKQISISAVCSSAAVPESTGHRWIEKLIEAGMVVREKHPNDRRMNWVRLSDKSVERLSAYFDDLIATHFSA